MIFQETEPAQLRSIPVQDPACHKVGISQNGLNTDTPQGYLVSIRYMPTSRNNWSCTALLQSCAGLVKVMLLEWHSVLSSKTSLKVIG